MTKIELFRRLAEECLRKANAVSDRQRARLLLVQAHNQLKSAEELEAEQLNARDQIIPTYPASPSLQLWHDNIHAEEVIATSDSD